MANPEALDLDAVRRLAVLVDYSEQRTAIGNMKPDSLATVQLAKRTLMLVDEVAELRRHVATLRERLAEREDAWLKGACEHRDPESSDLWRSRRCPECAGAEKVAVVAERWQYARDGGVADIEAAESALLVVLDWYRETGGEPS